MLHLFLDGKAWFKPKRYGIGAYPATWQGWTVTLAYVGVIAGMGLRGARERGDIDAAWWSVVGLASLLFVIVAWRKTAGGWRWRWGGDKGDARQRRHRR